MPSALGFFGSHPPLRFAAWARGARALVKVAASVDPNSVWSGGSVRGGDYCAIERFCSPGNYPTTVTNTGFLDVKAAGDRSRQLILCEVYSRRLLMWTGDAPQYINNRAPVGSLLTLVLTSGQTLPPLALLSQFTDFEHDTLSIVSISGSLPPGTVISGGFLIGRVVGPEATGSFLVTARDIALDFGVTQVNWTVHAVASEAGSLTEEQRLKTRVNGSLS